MLVITPNGLSVFAADITAFRVMSALPPKADIYGATRDVRFGPKADMAPFIRSSRRGAGRRFIPNVRPLLNVL
jgi:hypothetical protein